MQGEGSVSITSLLHAKSHPSHEKCSPSKIQNRERFSVRREWSGDDETCYGKIPSSKIQNRECISVGRGWSGVDGAYMKE